MAPKHLCESLRAYADLKVTKYAKHYNIKFRHPHNFKNAKGGWDVLNWIDSIPFYKELGLIDNYNVFVYNNRISISIY